MIERKTLENKYDSNGQYICDYGRDYCVLKEKLLFSSIEHIYDQKILEKKHDIGKGTLDDVCNCDNSSCELREIATKKYTRRQLEQIRCIADYAYILGENNNKHFSMDEAGMAWVADGYAGIFAKVYTEKKNKHEVIRHWDLFVETEKEIRHYIKEKVNN